ncbi:DUF5131 family protein [uncultured Alistipes sp.]|uniref:DUF5131 family protein n=1 Tax=uncultured Alistipes sp. TaxID=538949 RepID=UPI0027D94D6D|nr:DUF5131 family protein [uncultured Alistipes sp.]
MNKSNSRSTKIEWTEKTWNPVTGCSKISAGCVNCYAEKMSLRLKAMGQVKYRNGFAVTLHDDVLNEPNSWRNPHTVFVCSMSDLFHDRVPFDFIDKVMAVIESTPKHTYQLLTKRAERMFEYFATRPIPKNAWMGVTVDVQNSKSRIDYLRDLDASVKFLSCEPLLEDLGELNLHDIDWVIVGGESGSNARPMKKEWVLSIQKQCEEQKSTFFFKQWGAWGADGVKRSKKANGKLLDGKVYQAMPNMTSKSNQLNSITLANSDESINMNRENLINKNEIIMKNVNVNEEKNAVATANEVVSNSDVGYIDSRFEHLYPIVEVLPNNADSFQGFWINTEDKDMHGERAIRYRVVQEIQIGQVSYLIGAGSIINKAEIDSGLDIGKRGAACLTHYLSKLYEAYERQFSLKFRLKGYFEALLYRIMDESQLFELDYLCWTFEDMEKKLQSLNLEQIADIESESSLRHVFKALVDDLGVFDVYLEGEKGYDFQVYRDRLFKDYYKGYREEVVRMKKRINF